MLPPSKKTQIFAEINNINTAIKAKIISFAENNQYICRKLCEE